MNRDELIAELQKLPGDIQVCKEDGDGLLRPITVVRVVTSNTPPSKTGRNSLRWITMHGKSKAAAL